MYLTSILKIRSEEESDKSALMLRKCPVRPLYTMYDLIKKVLNVEDVNFQSAEPTNPPTNKLTHQPTNQQNQE